MTARKATQAHGLPTLDGGDPPTPGTRVLTFTGLVGTILWSTSPTHSVSRNYPAGEVWHTLVRFPDHPARPFPTTTLRRHPEPTPCP